MEKIIIDLKNWFIEYIKHRDIFLKKIIKITQLNDNLVEVTYKENKIKYYVTPLLEDLFNQIKKLNNNEQFNIITLNSKNNLNSCVKNWNTFSKFINLKIFFVNPYTKEHDKKWILSPFAHEKIADLKNLKQGLVSISDSIEKVK
ncbi:MAG: hypothetical protein ACLFPJ_03935 [Candidatus Woesearchaeota archaeon]